MYTYIYVYMYIYIIYTYICIHIYTADANAAAKELADAACGRILTYADVCRRMQKQEAIAAAAGVARVSESVC
jgi:hypothetical protein